MPIPNQFIAIDEEGYGKLGDLRIVDKPAGQELLNNIQLHESGTLLSTFGGAPVIIEAFDEPLVAAQVSKAEISAHAVQFSLANATPSTQWKIILPYEVEFEFDPKMLTLDEWDRFHGFTTNGIPFVFSRKAQAEFFNLVDEFNDESITINRHRIMIPNYLEENQYVEKNENWTNIYHTEVNPGWNLGAPAPMLKDMLPRLKLPKSKIIVLGCGEGHDAAYFAQQGHIVTAVDFSEEAISRAKKHYSNLSNINFMQADIFKLPKDFDNTFDLVFEHTCFCAINPIKRNELIKIWHRLLNQHGQLMAILFATQKLQGPPYGGSEWEYRERLKNYFQFLFWGRIRISISRRMGRELFILATKR